VKHNKRSFVNPRDLKASELKTLVSLFKHNRGAPIVTGHVFIKEIIDIEQLHELIDRKLVTIDGGYARLTSSGIGIAKTFSNRPILGDD
jgi:fructose-1,6-bisphosphatase